MKTIKKGDAGSEVVRWQQLIGVAPSDGVFGAFTEIATIAWQKAHGLDPDGVVGERSWSEAGVIDTVRVELPELVRGIDVSAIQGELTDADWAAIAASGIRFAMMRGVVGNEYKDAKLAVNVARAKAHGIAAGAYVFPFPLPHLDPRRQAEFFASLLDGVGSNVGEMPIAFDLEWPPPEERDKLTGRLIDTWAKWGCSPSQIRDWGLACLERGEELTGHTWMVYTYRYFWKRIEGAKAGEYGRRPLWLADYAFKGRWPTAEEAVALSVPAPWSKITIVQHDGDGGLRLPNGRDADFNVLLGGEAALAELTQQVRNESLDAVPDLPTILATIAATRQGVSGAIVDAGIAEYRKERPDHIT